MAPDLARKARGAGAGADVSRDLPGDAHGRERRHRRGLDAHRLWKQRLAEAVASGRSEWTPEDVCRDDGCECGRWLREGVTPRDGPSPHFAKVRALHAAFHQSAGQVLRLALGGRRAGAERANASGSAFVKASSALVVAMMDWKAARRG